MIFISKSTSFKDLEKFARVKPISTKKNQSSSLVLISEIFNDSCILLSLLSHLGHLDFYGGTKTNKIRIRARDVPALK